MSSNMNNRVRLMVMSFVVAVALAACSSNPETTTPPTTPPATITLDGTVTGEVNALVIDDKPLTVPATAAVQLRGQSADARVVRPGVRLQGTATQDAQGRLTLVQGEVGYSSALSGVLQSVNDSSITLRQGERSITLPLAETLLIHGETSRADSLPIGRQVTAFGHDDGSGLTVLELWSAAVTMNMSGNMPENLPSTPDADSGADGGADGDENSNSEPVFVNLPLVRADRNAGVLQLGHPSNVLEVRITSDTLLDAGSPDPNAFWQAVTVGAPVIVEGSLAADGVITAWYVGIFAPEIDPVPWLVLEGPVERIQPNRGLVLEGVNVTSNGDTRYALVGTSVDEDVSAADFWARLEAGDMVFIEGWQEANGDIIANFIVRFEDVLAPPRQVLAGRVIGFDVPTGDVHMGWLDLLLDDVVMHIATDANTTYSEQTGAVSVPNEPAGTPLTAAAFWNALPEDAFVTVYGAYGRGDFVAEHITWRSDETYLSVSGTISDLNEAAQQVRLAGVDVVLQLSARTYFTDPYFFDPMPMPEPHRPMNDDGSDDRVDGGDGGGDVPAADMLPTAPLELFWQEARPGRMVMAEGVVQGGVFGVHFLTLLPDPNEPRIETIEGIVSDLDAATKTFNVLDLPAGALDFTNTRRYALMGESVNAAEFWAALRAGDWVVMSGGFTVDATGSRVFNVESIDIFKDVPLPPPLFATEGIVQSLDSDSKSLRLFDVPELTVMIPDDAVYLTPTGEADGAQFWRDVNVGEGIFVEGTLEGDLLTVQLVERFDRDRPQVVNAAVLELDRTQRQLLLDSAPTWRVSVRADTEYTNALGEVLSADAFWNTLSEGDRVTVAGKLNPETTFFVAESIILTSRPHVHTLEGSIERVAADRQQFTLVAAPGVTIWLSDDTRLMVTPEPIAPEPVEPGTPPMADGFADPHQWLTPGTFVVVSGVREGDVLRAREVIIFHEATFREGRANVLEVGVSIASDGHAVVSLRGELADPCTALARVEQAFDGNIITLTVISRTDISRPCTDVTVPFNEQVTLEQPLEPGTYTLNVNQVSLSFDVSETVNPERSAAFVETVNARLLENERGVQLEITGFLSDPCHALAGYDVAVAGSVRPDGSSGIINVQLWQQRLPTFQQCAAVLEPFATTLELNDLMMPAGNYTIDVNGVQTRLTVPDGLTTRSEARVERVEVLVLESFPLQVQAVAYGFLPSSCDSLNGQQIIRNGNRFIVTLWQESILGPCLPVTEAFEAVINLDVWGLPAGDYVVEVNGAQGAFSFAVANLPELCGSDAPDDCTPPVQQP